MLPFMKSKHEAAVVDGDDEPIVRKPDNGDDPLEMLGAVAEDMLMAFQKKDKALLKGALEALCEYVQDMDQKQDEQQLEGNT